MRPANEAPMPPWWVERRDYEEAATEYEIWGGGSDKAVRLCSFNAEEFSNAKELAELIVQRTKP